MVQHLCKMLCIALWLTGMTACGGGGDTQSASTASSADTLADTSVPTPEPKACEVQGKILDGNKLVLRDLQLMLCIVADSSTYDADYGDSHRILEVYETRECRRIERKELPVNVSPDFAYFLAEITYNNSSRIAAIRGFNTIYLYDLENRRLLPAISPRYASERFGEDAQSGMIVHLELWEDYLIGYARDNGCFAFDLRNDQEPKAIMPYAEYKTANEEFNAMFLLESHLGGTQAIVPSFDPDSSKFAINPLLAQPQELLTETVRSAKNNRYVVIRKATDNKALAVDLLRCKPLDLPDEVALKPVQEVLKWAKAQK